MSPDLVVFAIRSLIRFGRTLESAAEQKVRDRDLIFPQARQVDFNLTTWLRDLLTIPASVEAIERNLGASLDTCWDAANWCPRTDPADAAERLIAAALKTTDERITGADRRAVEETAAYVIVCQWAAGSGPPSPYARVVLDLADIAFEYISADPAVVGVGGNGEKLIMALATNFAQLIPDAQDIDAVGRRRGFGERLAAAMFRGGLQAIAAHPDYAFGEAHLQELVRNSLPPLMQALPNDLQSQVRWSEVGEALVGPAASAALSTMAANPQAFFGSDLAPSKALGAVTQTLLLETSKAGLRASFTDEGLIRLFRATAQLAADRPALFVGGDGKPAGALTRDLFQSVAGVLAKAGPHLSKDVATDVALAALTAVQRNAASFIHFDPNWDRTAVRLADEVVGALRNAVDPASPFRIGDIFSNAQLVSFGRIVLEELAASPAMIGLAGDKRGLDTIVSAAARAMALDTNLLLTSDDWLKIVAAAAEQAARNPGRLFDLDQDDPGKQLATTLIGHLLTAGSQAVSDGRIAEDGVLFGRTLREMVVIALKFGANHAAAMIEKSDTVRDLALRIEALSRRVKLAVGADDVLALFEKALPRLLAGGATIAADPAVLDRVVSLVREGKLEDAARLLVAVPGG